MQYKAENIRNIAFMGHGGDGKTTLTESILFGTGAADRYKLRVNILKTACCSSRNPYLIYLR